MCRCFADIQPVLQTKTGDTMSEEATREANEDDVIEISDAVYWLYPEDFLNEGKKLEKKYTIESVTVTSTKWGNRSEIYCQNDEGKYKISSWNLVCRERISLKAKELIGKTMTVKGYNEKKVLVSFGA